MSSSNKRLDKIYARAIVTPYEPIKSNHARAFPLYANEPESVHVGAAAVTPACCRARARARRPTTRRRQTRTKHRYPHPTTTHFSWVYIIQVRSERGHCENPRTQYSLGEKTVLYYLLFSVVMSITFYGHQSAVGPSVHVTCKSGFPAGTIAAPSPRRLLLYLLLSILVLFSLLFTPHTFLLSFSIFI